MSTYISPARVEHVKKTLAVALRQDANEVETFIALAEWLRDTRPDRKSLDQLWTDASSLEERSGVLSGSPVKITVELRWGRGLARPDVAAAFEREVRDALEALLPGVVRKLFDAHQQRAAKILGFADE